MCAGERGAHAPWGMWYPSPYDENPGTELQEVVMRATDRIARCAAMAGHQPPRARHARHGRDGALLRGHARHAPRRHDDGGTDAPLLLRDGARQHDRVLRGEGRRDVRQAGGRSHRPGHPARPPLVRRARRARARDAAQAAARRGLRGHRGGRPRVHPLGVLHRPERHRARGIVVGRRRHRPAEPTTTTASCSPTREPVPAVAELRAGGVDALPETHLT